MKATARVMIRPSISVNELAALTHTHQSSVSVVVSRLVDRGFVRRVAAKADRRRMVLSLTAKGKRVAGRSPDVPQDRLVRGIAGLPAARRRQLAASLTQLAAVMRGDRRPAVMFFEERTARKQERRHV